MFEDRLLRILWPIFTSNIYYISSSIWKITIDQELHEYFSSYFQVFFLIFKDLLLNSVLFLGGFSNYLFQFIKFFFQNMLFASHKTSVLFDKNGSFYFLIYIYIYHTTCMTQTCQKNLICFTILCLEILHDFFYFKAIPSSGHYFFLILIF